MPMSCFKNLANAIATGKWEYFLGSIVVTRNEEGQDEVADGQQRLATLTILLAAFRDHFAKIGDKERVEEITRKYLVTKDLDTLVPTARVTMNVDDNKFFKEHVLSDYGSSTRKLKPIPESHKKIAGVAKMAAVRVKTIVAGLNQADGTKAILRWVAFLRDSVKVIWVTVPDQGNAYEIFETLNDRGVDLSKSDLLKNRLFACSDKSVKEAQQKWAAMIGALRTVTADDITVTYIRHLWISRNGPTREKELYASIKNQITSVQHALDLSAELADNAPVYAAILNSDHEFWGKYGSVARGDISTLTLLRMERIRPVILAVVAAFSLPEAKKALRLAVSWSVRLLIAGGPAGTIEEQFGLAAMKTRNKEIATAKQLNSQLASIIPNDAAFADAFSVATVTQAYLARYYLRTLEDTKKGVGTGIVADKREEHVNLEHVLPENPSASWSHISRDIAEANWKRIGNMVLLDAKVNSQIGNDDFVTSKAPAFRKCASLLLTSEVGQLTKWDERDIADRQKKLAALAVRAWPLK